MTRRTKLLSSALALSLAVGAGGFALSAQAGMDGRMDDRARLPVPPIFQAADGNGDGAVSAEAFADYLAEQRQTRVRQRFQQLDQNGDGALSPDEFRAAGQTALGPRGRAAGELGERLFWRLDANDDEALQPIEVTSFAERLFARADANADGRVTQAELQERRADRDGWHGGHHEAGYDGRRGGDCR
ncbi:hypothetical protein CKO28_19005 [Rhodovibrio sodomensis]|uniref:EF-hand domain-containing protein n=1 Tax=Rhodovibrio sodomensis TaxID=1088 RepID=A0ABS1DKU9_9PROT|nr:EF-hand domain-containing protein [Rhodovibrio sodomensis]MBK1670128.1 hypothetical protein [Rhodovibrio sodomensis]